MLETKYLEFLLGAGHIGTLCLVYTSCQTPRRKAGVECKSYCLYHWSEPLLTVRVVGILQKSVLPDTSQGPALSAGLFKSRNLGLLCQIFSAQSAPWYGHWPNCLHSKIIINKTQKAERGQPAVIISVMPFTGPGLSHLTDPTDHKDGFLKFLC